MGVEGAGGLWGDELQLAMLEGSMWVMVFGQRAEEEASEGVGGGLRGDLAACYQSRPPAADTV